MNRYECMKVLASKLNDELVVVSLGKMVDEWETARPSEKNLHIGALGVNLGVAIGLSIALPHRRVICLDSDGSELMDPGGLIAMGCYRPANLIVIVWDNEAYDSLYTEPPLPTVTHYGVDLAKMAEGAGAKRTVTVRDVKAFEQAVTEALAADALTYIVAKHDLTPPAEPIIRKRSDGVEDKYRFIRYIESSEGVSIKPPCAIL